MEKWGWYRLYDPSRFDIDGKFSENKFKTLYSNLIVNNIT